MIQDSIKNTLLLLKDTLCQLTDDEYNRPLPVLSGGTIGQHVRHIAEMFVCLDEGLKTGVVCYEHRRRDKEIEGCRQKAMFLLTDIISSLSAHDVELKLEVNFEPQNNGCQSMTTNYYRELVYNLEHAIHHMALIRIGIAASCNLKLDEGFGVAPSTIRYRQEMEQIPEAIN